MFGVGKLSKLQRFLLGTTILLVVDVIWVTSSEITQYIFTVKNYGKPYFSTYLKTSLFVLYLAGFLIWRSWWYQCKRNNAYLVEQDAARKIESEQILGDPIFVPVKNEDRVSGTESDDITNSRRCRSVRFSNLSEVRQLPDGDADEAALSRMSYASYMLIEDARQKAASRLTVRQVAKLALIFCIMLFVGELSYEEALRDSEAGIVNILASTSGLFTLVFAAVFPSNNGDRITLSKFVAVLLSIGGVVLVSISKKVVEPGIPLGALWSLCGAILFAVYLVLLRRRVGNEDKLNIPMLFGFIGLFSMSLLWPVFFVLHYTRAEEFEWPSMLQWLFLVADGIIGTVVSQLLWVWGCFLTSSLVATLSLSLTIPMSMLADIALKDVSYNWMFYVGVGPVFIAFFAVSVLSHYETWDPVLLAAKKCLQFVCRRRFNVTRIRDLDREQCESLIGINSDGLT